MAAVAIAGPAAAQVGPNEEEPAADAAVAAPAGTEVTEAEDRQDIVVTGTRVVRDGYQAPTPLTVLSREDIENTSPSNNIADFVNQLPSLAGSTRPSNSRLNLSSGQAGINALNLRNLGEVRTLVLLDGRRSVASTITGLVDVNTIPQLLIDRVEVVTGGASATYGSDAVGGVVNFILDKKFKGLKIQADSGVTTYGDGFNYSFGAAGGMSFAGGRGHILVSGEIAHRDGIFDTIDRDWNHTGYVRIQDPNWVSGVSTTPRYLIRTQVGAANSTPGGLITGSTGGLANRLRGLYFNQGGQILQYQYGALTFPSPTGAAAPTLTQGGDWRVNDSGRRIGLDPEDDRHGAFGRLSFEVADGIELFAEASYNWQEVFFNAGPNLATGITYQADNAFLINAFNASGYSLAGINTVTVATTAADLPFRVANNRRKVQRYVLGAQGDFQAFGERANWDVYAQYGRADLREQLRNIMHTARINAATDSVFSVPGDTSSPIVCRINADANPNNNDPNCVPLNRLGLNVANPAAIDYVLGDPYRDEVVEQTVAGANFSFSPFATWAGDVTIAVGAEYRKEQIKGFVPAEFQPVVSTNAAGQLVTANAWSVGNYLPTNGSYDVKEAYFETVVPLGFGLEFNGAIRATDYSSSGFVTTWRAGATWQPIDDIRLRVTRSRDIRAPNLNELFQAGTANSDSVQQPVLPGGRTARQHLWREHFLFAERDRQSEPVGREGGFVEHRRSHLAALPPRFQRLRRLFPDRDGGCDRHPDRSEHHQFLPTGERGFLRRDHPGSEQRDSNPVPQPAFQLRQQAGPRNRFRGLLPAAAERPVLRRGRRQHQPARPGDALYRQYHRLRNSGSDPARHRRLQRRPVQHAQLDIPGERGLRHADLLDHRRRAGGQQGQIYRQRYRVPDQLPDRPSSGHRDPVPDL